MRTFRKCITEFVLDPVEEPTGFQSHLWRYPVRIDTAIEYLGVTPEEYELLFQGIWPRQCAAREDNTDVPQIQDGPQPWQFYGFASEEVGNASWQQIVIQ